MQLKKLLIVLLALSLLSFVGLQVLIFPEIKSCALSSSAISSAISANSIFPLAISCFSLSHLLFFIFPVLFAASLFYRPFFYEFSNFLTTIFSNKKYAITALIIFLSFVFSFYFAPGDVLISDAGQFQAVTFSYLNSIKSFDFPDFTFDFYGGSMQFYYYGPFYFVLSSLVSLVVGNINLGLKLLLFFFHIASAVAFFLFANKLTKNYKMSFIAALAYSLSFEHVAKITIGGRTLLAVIYLLMPLFLLIFEKLIDKSIAKLKSAIFLSFIMAAIFLTSPADAVYVFPLLAVYAFLRFSSLNRFELLKPLSLAFFLFLLLTAFWTIPFFAERQFVSASDRAAYELTPNLAPSSAERLVSWPGFLGISPVYYVGLSLLFLAFFAVTASIKKRGIGLVLSACFLLSLFLTIFYSGRAGPILVFSLAILAVFGVPYMYKFISRKFKISEATFTTLILLIVLIDLLPAVVQPAYADFSYEKNVFDEGLPVNYAGGRVLDLHSNYRTYYPYVSYTNNNIPEVFGILPEGAPRSFAYIASIATGAAQDIYDNNSTLSDTVLQGLFLFNTEYLIIHNQQRGIPADVSFASKRYSFGFERDTEIINLDNSPVILSRSLQCCFTHSLDAEEGFFTKLKFNSRNLDWDYTSSLVSEMGINLETSTADYILTKSHQTLQIEPTKPLVFNIVAQSYSPKKVVMIVNSSSESFARLAYSYYPWLKISVNGEKQLPIQTAMNFVALKLNEGISEIVIEADVSSLRKVLNFISFITLMLLLLLLFLIHFKK